MDVEGLAAHLVALVRDRVSDDGAQILDTYMASGEPELVIAMACRIAVDDGLALPVEVLEYEEWMDDDVAARVRGHIGQPAS